MAKTGTKDTFTDLFKTTADRTKKILKEKTKRATGKFSGGSSASTSVWDTFKNMFSQFSVPTATKSGKVKFKTSSASTAKTDKKGTGVDFLKSPGGLAIVGIGTLAGIYFLTKPSK